MFKDKGLIIGIVATIILIGGGVFFFSKGSGPSTTVNSAKVSSSILVPQGDYETGGIENGSYLPASTSAKVTLVEFGDYQCPACGEYHPLIKQLLTDFAGKVNFVFRNFPLSQHTNAPIASRVVEAAGLQGKYWQMHDKVYESQSEWSDSATAETIFETYASSLGLNMTQFKTDINSQKVKDKIQRDQNDGSLVNLDATPTFYLDGVKIANLPGSYDDFKALVSAELAK